MPLIKHAQAESIAREAIVLDLGDLARQGEQIVKVAKDRAAKMIADAESERKRLIAGAVEQGHQQGFQKGLEEGRAKGQIEGHAAGLKERKAATEQVEKAWAEALGVFESARGKIVSDASRDVLKLAVRIAERVTKRAIRLDPQVAAAQLEEVLALVLRPTSVVVEIHPDDREIVTAALPELMQRFSTARHVELRDNAALSKGSCVARLRDPKDDEDAGDARAGGRQGGEIDASIDTQLARIIEALMPDETDADLAEHGGEEHGGEA